MTKLRVSSLILGAMLCAALTSTLFAQNIAPSSAGGGGGDDKKPAKTDTKKNPTTDEQIAALAEQMKKMQEVIDAQQQKIDTLEKIRTFSATGVVPKIGGDEHIGSTSKPERMKDQTDGQRWHLGDATITPVGQVEFTGIFRSRNTGNTAATNFGSLPFNNTVQGFQSETRFTAQKSRFGFRVDAKIHDWKVLGFMEGEFLGNDAANIFVSTNRHTLALRQFWVDMRNDKFEVLAGQAWSLLTPNRKGLSPLNEDVFVTRSLDESYVPGLVFARQAGIRFVYHPSDRWAFGVSMENPQQYVGVGEVIFPFAFNAQLGTQFDAGNNAGAPNLLPDVIGKVAYDSKSGRFHIEMAGLMRSFRIANVPVGVGCGPPIGPCPKHTSFGAGGSLNAVVGLTDNIKLVSNNFFSSGGGRYIGGLGPDVVIVPIGGPVNFDLASPRQIDSYSTVQGVEAQVTPKWLFYGYYSGAYFRHSAFPDITSPLVTKPFIGFGGTNSPNSANRAIQGITAGLTRTVWSDPNYGAFEWSAQYGYYTRSPWFVAAGAPKHALVNQLMFSLRYVLPGKAPDDK